MGCKFRNKGHFMEKTMGSFVFERGEITTQGDYACSTRIHDAKEKPIEKRRCPES